MIPLILGLLLLPSVSDERLQERVRLLDSDQARERRAATLWLRQELRADRAIHLEPLLADLGPEGLLRMQDILAGRADFGSLLVAWLGAPGNRGELSRRSLPAWYRRFGGKGAPLDPSWSLPRPPRPFSRVWVETREKPFPLLRLLHLVNREGAARKPVLVDPRQFARWKSYQVNLGQAGTLEEVLYEVLSGLSGKESWYFEEKPNFFWLTGGPAKESAEKVFLHNLVVFKQGDSGPANLAGKNLGLLGLEPLEDFFVTQIVDDGPLAGPSVAALTAGDSLASAWKRRDLLEQVPRLLQRDWETLEGDLGTTLRRVLAGLPRDPDWLPALRQNFAQFPAGSQRILTGLIVEKAAGEDATILRDGLINSDPAQSRFLLGLLNQQGGKDAARMALSFFAGGNGDALSCRYASDLVSRHLRELREEVVAIHGKISGLPGLHLNLLLARTGGGDEAAHLLGEFLLLDQEEEFFQAAEYLAKTRSAREWKTLDDAFLSLSSGSLPSGPRLRLACLGGLVFHRLPGLWQAAVRDLLEKEFQVSGNSWSRTVAAALGRLADEDVRNRLCGRARDTVESQERRLLALHSLEQFLAHRRGDVRSDARLGIVIKLESLKREAGPVQEFFLRRILRGQAAPMPGEDFLARDFWPR